MVTRPRHLRDRKVLEQRRAADRRIDDTENGNDDGGLRVEDRGQNVQHDCKFKNATDDRPAEL
jgi:hypothetical protein